MTEDKYLNILEAKEIVTSQQSEVIVMLAKSIFYRH